MEQSKSFDDKIQVADIDAQNQYNFSLEQVYHVESNGEALLIFNKLKLACTGETMKFIVFAEKLAEQIRG